MGKTTFGFTRTLGSAELASGGANAKGRRHFEGSTSSLGDSGTQESQRSVSSLRNMSITNRQTTDIPPACGIPTRKANGFHNQTSEASEQAKAEKAALSPKRVSRINEGVGINLLHHSEIPIASVPRSVVRQHPQEAPMRPIRGIIPGTTTASTSAPW